MTSRVCARCDKRTSNPVVVAIEHGASVGGRTIYACPGRCAAGFPPQGDPFTEATALRRNHQQEDAR
ncbi:hypothetical protein [Streptomyces sp. NBRC 110028]|uniref:hypothetical protein n=1 Tax=Streptomyces sp. NBRC 110028 TaxID=1621260 RepID=UPI0006E28FC6|nr:hypothetical protein [Streptomyces sp. NBRC 110028]